MGRRRPPLFLALAALVIGCGPSHSGGAAPVVGLAGRQPAAAQNLGFPAFATKNTTRVGGADPVADAAGVARAVFPSVSDVTRPRAVVLADSHDADAAMAAAVLMSAPLRAPLLLSDGSSLPGASAGALGALAPTGSPQAGGAQLIRVGNVARPAKLRTANIAGDTIFALARAIDAFMTQVRGRASDQVVVVSADAPAFAMPAAAWAAKSGNPILFVNRRGIPPQTQAALAAHQQPRIYVVGPSSVVPDSVLTALRQLGTVTRVAGPDPVSNAVAFARYADRTFGWGARDPGHGLVFASQSRPLDAAAAAPLSNSGTYGPLLLVDQPSPVPPLLSDYLLDIQPGYHVDPVRGVYNHGWMIGDTTAISVDTQATIDAELEIVPVSGKTPRASAPAGPQPSLHPTPAPQHRATTGTGGATGATR